jgi:hypothetical protein
MATSETQDFYDLAEHNIIQKIIFTLLFLAGTIGSFYLILPLLEEFFSAYLAGSIISNGDIVNYLLDSKSDIKETSYLFNWAIDVYKHSPQEARYWLNPVLALIIPCSFFGLFFSFIFTALLPKSIGLIRQKIERVIASEIDKITLRVFGIHNSNERNKIKELLLNADLRDIHDFERTWRMSVEDIISLRSALLWQNAIFPMSLSKFFFAIGFYLRFYVTSKYSNFILGLVYFGAAVLIFIIGLRGLKFIPAQEPSLVFFSLGLEFCLLVTYALTMMYDREDYTSDTYSVGSSSNEQSLLGREFSNGKETEDLLKMFILNQDVKNKEN